MRFFLCLFLLVVAGNLWPGDGVTTDTEDTLTTLLAMGLIVAGLQDLKELAK